MQRRITIKVLSFALIFVIVCSLGGCSILNNILSEGNTQVEKTKIGQYTDYKYLQLTDEEKVAYTYMLEAVQNDKFECEFKVESDDCEETLSRSIAALVDDHPEFFWLQNGYNSTVTTHSDGNYTVEVRMITFDCWKDTDKINLCRAELESKVNSIVNAAQKYGSDYEKALFVHDYLVKNTVYDTEGLEEAESPNHSAESEMIYTPYGCLINGKAVCSGYSKAYKMILDRLGIECIILDGMAGGITHAWNCIKMDGEYYLVDVTWDDPVGSTGKYISYDYFGLTDKEMDIDHNLDTGLFTYPKCTASKYNYYKFNNLCLDVYSINTTAAVIDAQSSLSSAVVKYTNEAAYKSAVRDLITNRNFSKIPSLSRYNTIKYTLKEDNYIIRFIK